MPKNTQQKFSFKITAAEMTQIAGKTLNSYDLDFIHNYMGSRREEVRQMILHHLRAANEARKAREIRDEEQMNVWRRFSEWEQANPGKTSVKCCLTCGYHQASVPHTAEEHQAQTGHLPTGI